MITLLSTSLWTFYGLLKPGGLLIVTVNGAGAALEAIYVMIFLIYAPNDTRVSCLINFVDPFFTSGLINLISCSEFEFEFEIGIFEFGFGFR